jgi:hypothetical protein
MGASEIAGSDQLDGMLAMTPDERLDALVAMVAFTRELRGGRTTLRLLLEKSKGPGGPS